MNVDFKDIFSKAYKIFKNIFWRAFWLLSQLNLLLEDFQHNKRGFQGYILKGPQNFRIYFQKTFWISMNFLEDLVKWLRII